MKPVLQRSSAIVFALALAQTAPAFAQQLLQPAVPASTQPAAGTGPRLRPSQSVAPATVPSAPDTRASPGSIRERGPANEKPATAIRNSVAAPAGASARLLDASGVPLAGFIQVAPNRVYDPVSRRYHWTVRKGNQQKILE